MKMGFESDRGTLSESHSKSCQKSSLMNANYEKYLLFFNPTIFHSFKYLMDNFRCVIDRYFTLLASTKAANPQCGQQNAYNMLATMYFTSIYCKLDYGKTCIKNKLFFFVAN